MTSDNQIEKIAPVVDDSPESISGVQRKLFMYSGPLGSSSTDPKRYRVIERDTSRMFRPRILSRPREKASLSAWMSKLYSTKTYARVFAEQFADMQAEYDESVTQGRRCHAKWVVVRGHLIVLKVVVEHALASTVGKLIREIVK